jgi:hypothetical protein
MAEQRSEQTVHWNKYYRVLRANDPVYRAPGLISRPQCEDGFRNDEPLFFTDGRGVLQFAFCWGSTVCEVTVPKGIEVKESCDADGVRIFSASSIRLGKIQRLTGQVISDLLLTSREHRALNMSIIQCFIDRFDLQLRINANHVNHLIVSACTKKQWSKWSASDRYPYDCRNPEQQHQYHASQHAKHIKSGQHNSPAPVFKKPTTFHLKSIYPFSLADATVLASTITKLLVVNCF